MSDVSRGCLANRRQGCFGREFGRSLPGQAFTWSVVSRATVVLRRFSSFPIDSAATLGGMKPLAVVFDGDDTLWFIEHLYDEARDECCKIIKETGLDAAGWEQLERSIDLENVVRLGFSAERFPTSCVEAYQRLVWESGRQTEASVETAIRTAATEVFWREASPAHGVNDICSILEHQCHTVLLTKGEEWVQRKRIAEAGLVNAFDHVSIVREKTESDFREALRAIGVPPSSAWSVGNSLASDVNPALRIGMRAIWIDAYVWEYERRELSTKEGVIAAPDLEAATRILLDSAERETGVGCGVKDR